MKYLVSFFVITFLMFGLKHSYADNHIVYIDMDKVLNESKLKMKFDPNNSILKDLVSRLLKI